VVNKRFILGILVIVLVFGMTIVGCDNGGNNTDSGLNGIWYSIEYTGYSINFSGPRTIFNNGTYEWIRSFNENFIREKGTYTYSDNKITFTSIYYIGSIFGLDNKLYTKDELKSALQMTEEEFVQNYPNYFNTFTADYYPNEKKYVFESGGTYIKID